MLSISVANGELPVSLKSTASTVTTDVTIDVTTTRPMTAALPDHLMQSPPCGKMVAALCHIRLGRPGTPDVVEGDRPGDDVDGVDVQAPADTAGVGRGHDPAVDVDLHARGR